VGGAYRPLRVPKYNLLIGYTYTTHHYNNSKQNTTKQKNVYERLLGYNYAFSGKLACKLSMLFCDSLTIENLETNNSPSWREYFVQLFLNAS